MEELAALVKSIDAKKKELDEAQSIIAQSKKDDLAFNILIFATKTFLDKTPSLIVLSKKDDPSFKLFILTTEMLLTISKNVILKRIRDTMSESEQRVQDILGQNR